MMHVGEMTNHTTSSPGSNDKCFWISDTSEDACIVGFLAVLVSVVIVAIGVAMIIWHRSSRRQNDVAKRASSNHIETESNTEYTNGTTSRTKPLLAENKRSEARSAPMQLAMHNGDSGGEARNPWSKFEVQKNAAASPSSLDRLPEEAPTTRERSDSDESFATTSTTSTLRSFYSVGGTRSIRRTRRPTRRSRNRKKNRTRRRAQPKRQVQSVTVDATPPPHERTDQPAADGDDLLLEREPAQHGDRSRSAVALATQSADQKSSEPASPTTNPWSKFEVQKNAAASPSSLDRLPEEAPTTRERSDSDESIGSAGTLKSFYSVGGSRSVRRVRRPARRSRNRRKKKKRTQPRAQPKSQPSSSSRPPTRTDMSSQWVLPAITEDAAEAVSSETLTRVDTVLLSQQYPAPPSAPQ